VTLEYQTITTPSSRGVALWLFPKKYFSITGVILRYDDTIRYDSVHEKNRV
jgi:hypothetical protein